MRFPPRRKPRVWLASILGSLLIGCAARHAPDLEHVRATPVPAGEPCVVTRVDAATGEPSAVYTVNQQGLASAWQLDTSRRETSAVYAYDERGRLIGWTVESFTRPSPGQTDPLRPLRTTGSLHWERDQISELVLTRLRLDEAPPTPITERRAVQTDGRGRIQTWRRWTEGGAWGEVPPLGAVRYRWGRITALVYPATGTFETQTTEREVERWAYNLRGEVVRHSRGSSRSRFHYDLRGDAVSWSGQPGLRARWDHRHHLLRLEPDGPAYDYESGGRIHGMTLNGRLLWRMEYSPSCPADLSGLAFTPTFDPATDPWQVLLGGTGTP